MLNALLDLMLAKFDNALAKQGGYTSGTDVAENTQEMHSWKRGIVRGDGGPPGGHNPNPDLGLMAKDHVLRYFPYK